MSEYKNYTVVCFWTNRDGSTSRREINVLAQDEKEAKYTLESQLPEEAHQANDLRIMIK